MKKLFLLLITLPIFAQTAVERIGAANTYCADAGSTDAYACNLSSTPVAYVTGALYSFKANTANTGAATINFNSKGAKTIVKVAGGITTALADNDIRAGQIVTVMYDGANMQMQSTLGNAGGASPAGSVVTDAQCWASASTFGVCAAPELTGTNFSGIPNAATTATSANTASAIVARDANGNTALSSISLGSSPPSLTPGTGAASGGAEGTVPSVCAASSVDCYYFDSTQHGPLLSKNNGSYAPWGTYHPFGATFSNNGSALVAADSIPFTLPYACTIRAWNIALSPSGTATFKVWKIATGTATPTVSNSINTSGIAISTGTAVHSTTLSDFTSTAVAANDIVIISMTTVATATGANLTIQCD